MTLMAQYIEDRYPTVSKPEDYELFAYYYEKWLAHEKHEIKWFGFGFITYQFQGDACILRDMFVGKDFRLSGHAWEMFYWLRNEAQKKGCNVIITFSEVMGKNQHLGLAAIKAAGFIPHIQEQDRTVFIRGTN